MRCSRTPVLTAFILLLAGSVSIQAQDKPTLTPEDYGQWESIGRNITFSTEGTWVAYSISRVNEENELHLYSLEADTTHVVKYGSRPAFSTDGKWCAYTIGYSSEERERRQESRQPVHNKLGLFDLETGEEAIIEDVASFAFRDDGAWLVMRRYGIEGRESGGVDLVLREMATGRDTNFGNVSDFAWQDEGDLLALIIDAEGQAGNGVQLFDPGSATLRTLISSETVYKDPHWREEADDLAVMREREDEGFEDPTHDLIVWTGLNTRSPGMKIFDHSTVPAFPDSMRIVDYRSLSFSEDGTEVFFGIKAWEPKPAEPGRAEEDTTGAEPRTGRPEEGDDPSNVEVWHARDTSIMPEQKLRANSNRARNYISVWNLESDSFVQLADEVVEDVFPIEGTNRAYGTDATPYEREAMFGPNRNDIWVIDTVTGERTLIKEGLQYSFGVSPGGRYLLYLENDHYYTCDLESGAHVNITQGVPTDFIDHADDHTVEQKPPFRYAGWAEDDEAILIYDEFDIWAVAPDGSGAERLTFGAEDMIRHRYYRLDREQDFIALDEPMYMTLEGEWSKKYGYAVRDRRGRVTPLVFADESIAGLTRAEETDVYAYTRQDFDDSPDLFVGGPDLTDARQITNTNPFQADYAWGYSELVDFENSEGRPLQGALFYPADYEPGRQYPMIVYIYEITSNTVRRYSVPSERNSYNTTVWTQQGYFVLQSDIVYRDRNPGLSALDCITSAVETVLETGMIDPERVGLVGHSWGAYQTAFVVTQTDLFAAGVAGAPLTDLISMYLSIYWNSGSTDARIFEISQARMEVPFWEDMQAYIDNSPLHSITKLNTPLMIAFGDEDGAVDWDQGIELYNAARRAGKDFVMLVYPGENHSVRQDANRIDYHWRVLEWFNHYLKGDEAPAWITEGVNFLDRQKQLERSSSGDEGGRGRPGGPGRGLIPPAG